MAAIGSQMHTIVEGLEAVAGYNPERIGPTFDAIFGQLYGMLRKMARWITLITGEALDTILPDAVDLTEAIGAIMGQMQTIVEGLTAVAGYNPERIGPTFDAIFGQLYGMLRKFKRFMELLASEGLEQAAIEAAAGFTGAIEEILAMVRSAVETLERLRTYISPGEEALERFQRDMQFALERWVRWVTLTLQPLAEDLEDDTAALIEGVVRAMGASLELLAGLVDYVSPLETAIDAFIDDLGKLFTRFAAWASGLNVIGGAGTLLGIPPALLEVFSAVMDGLGTAVDVLTALVDYVGPSEEAIHAFIDDLRQLFYEFVHWVTERQPGSPQTLLDIPPELIDVFTNVMSGLGVAVDTLTALTDYVGPSEDAISAFTSDYTQLFEGFAGWAETTFAGVTFESTAAVAAVFGTTMSGLHDAVGTLTAIVDYAGPSDAAIQAFEGDYQRLFSGFAHWAATVLEARGWEAVAAVGAALSSVFTGLGAAVATLLAIVGYVGPSEGAINHFETDYQRLMTGFRQWATSTFTTETAAVVQAVGDAANALFTGLGAAADLLIAIRTYSSPAQTAIDGFMADVQALLIEFRDFATGQFTTESLAALSAFADTADMLFTAIGAALDTLAGIAEYTVSDSQFVLALQRFNQNLYTAIHSWQVWIIDIMSPETAALVAAFSGVLQEIVDGFRAALELLMDIEQANLPTTDELQAFLDALNTLFNAVVSNFQQVSIDLQAAGYDIQTVLYAIFNNINPDLWAAGLQTGAHFIGGLVQAMTDVNIITPLLDAMYDLAEQLEDILRAAWGIGSPSKEAKKIGGYFVQGLELGLRDLYGIPDMMRDALGMPALGGVTLESAPQRAFLTVRFEGAYQSGMSAREEQRITGAMLSELRRQGVVLATR